MDPRRALARLLSWLSRRPWTAAAVSLAAALGFATSGYGAGELVRLTSHDRQVMEASMRRRPYPGTPRVSARPLGARPRVALQVGHWKMDELPPDLRRLRDNTGAAWGPYREVDVNLKVARLTADILRGEGIEVEILPGTVPADYLADAFVAIHADGAWRPGARGWKAASAWRASEASRRLERSVAAAYASATGLPEDRAGITFGMKGYYAFSRHRYRHALSPFTPAIIVETGFITDARDREVLINGTAAVADGIASGVLRFLAAHTALDWKKLVPRYHPLQRVGEASAEVYAFPGAVAPVREVLEPGTVVSPVHRQGEWVEVVVRGNYRVFGWVREEQLAPLL